MGSSDGGGELRRRPLGIGNGRAWFSRHALALILVIAYLGLALAYSLSCPLYEPTDEVRHVRFVRHLAVYRTLPVQSAEGPRAQSHHPPLYYALGALVSGWVPVERDVYYEPVRNPHWDGRHWEVSDDNKNQYLHGDDETFPFRDVTLAVYVMRWMTVLIGAGVVWLSYHIGQEVFPDRPTLAVGAAAVVAFNPQFLHLSGAVNNDVAAALAGAGVLLACLQLVRRGPSWRADLTLGLLFGLALMTKLNLPTMAVPIGLAYLLAVWPGRGNRSTWRWRLWLLGRGCLTISALVVLIAGWWFGRNLVLYGDLTGMRQLNELWHGRPAGESFWALRQALPGLWSSLWGRFGYGQLPLPRAIYQAILALSAMGLLGYLIPILRREPLPLKRLALLGITIVALLALVGYYILIQPAGAMGRFLFPGLPAFAVLLMGGLSCYLPRRLTWVTGLAVTCGMGVLAVYALVGVVRPAFARPRPLQQAEIEAAPNPTDVQFGGLVRVLGYHLAPEPVEPGGTVEVTVYWLPLAPTDVDYRVFVHLLSEEGPMVAQRDTYPGLGKYLTSVWRPGVAFADTYRLYVPETAYAPDQGFVQVGLYLPEGPRLPTADGRDAVRLGRVRVEPRPGPVPNPLAFDYDGRMTLAGYDLDRRVVRPGETLRLTLYWQAPAPLEEDLLVFAHLQGHSDQVWALNDSLLLDGPDPTSRWEPGRLVAEVRELTVGETTPTDYYVIDVGLLDPSGERLPVVARDGHHLGTSVQLGRIQVLAE